MPWRTSYEAQRSRGRDAKVLAVHYRDIVAGEYVADLLVEGLVLVELKAIKELDDIHMAQCLNYLKATG